MTELPIAKTESNMKHIHNVLHLTLSEIMSFADEGLIDVKLFDDLYYHLLDNENIRKYCNINN